MVGDLIVSVNGVATKGKRHQLVHDVCNSVKVGDNVRFKSLLPSTRVTLHVVTPSGLRAYSMPFPALGLPSVRCAPFLQWAGICAAEHSHTPA